MEPQFSLFEIEVIIEALAMAAARHDAYARFRPLTASAEQHERKAKHMRELRARLVEDV